MHFIELILTYTSSKDVQQGGVFIHTLYTSVHLQYAYNDIIRIYNITQPIKMENTVKPPYTMDTTGIKISVSISEVSLFRRGEYLYLYKVGTC